MTTKTKLKNQWKNFVWCEKGENDNLTYASKGAGIPHYYWKYSRDRLHIQRVAMYKIKVTESRDIIVNGLLKIAIFMTTSKQRLAPHCHTSHIVNIIILFCPYIRLMPLILGFLTLTTLSCLLVVNAQEGATLPTAVIVADSHTCHSSIPNNPTCNGW